MNLDVDFLINFFNKHSNNIKKNKDEIGEQDASPKSSGKAVPKWADSYPTKRGPANMLGKQGEKWDTGLTRGSANKIW